LAKRLWVVILTLALVLVCWQAPTAWADASPVVSADKSVSIAGQSATIKAVRADLNDPNIRVLSVPAGKVGDVKPFEQIIGSIDQNKYEVLAAVNGAFFEAYNEGKKPINGTLVHNGATMHYETSSMIGFGSAGEAQLDRVAFRQYVYVDVAGGNYLYKQLFYLRNWNVIRPAGYTGYREAIITPDYGTETGDTDMVCVVVRNVKDVTGSVYTAGGAKVLQKGTVTAISQGNTAIPADGFLLLMPTSSAYRQLFHVGSTIDFVRQVWNSRTNTDDTADWINLTNITGCGPSLVLDGQVTADPAGEGWNDPKLTTAAGNRSFIGLTADKQLVFGTTPGLTIKNLAQVARAYNLTDAMNLDGGASSALWLGGRTITPAGRELSNIIAVVRLKVSEPAMPASGITADRTINGGSTPATSVKVSQEGWLKADSVVVVPGENNHLIDALAAAPLAGQEQAPILMVEGGVPTAEVIGEIKRLGAKRAYCIGFQADVVSEKLKAAIPGLEAKVLQGKGRAETANLVGDEIADPHGIFLVGFDALADAVSAGPYAAANGWLIRIADGAGVYHPEAWSLLKAGLDANNLVILGGTSRVQDTEGFRRMSGQDRYVTNRDFNEKMGLKTSKVYFADGYALAGALMVAPLAAQDNCPVVLAEKNDPNQARFPAGVTNDATVIGIGPPAR